MPRTKTQKTSTSNTATDAIKEELESKIKTEPDLCDLKFATPAVSKKVKASTSRADDSTKIEEG